MKALIVTIQSQNYGNRLQNFALQEVLLNMGLTVESLPISKCTLSTKFTDTIKRIMAYFPNQKIINGRWAYFNTFINYRKKFNGLDDSFSDIGIFIAGSDQIWNPHFPFNSSREFLLFASKEKRVAYAGSIGVESLPEGVCDTYMKNFNEFECISVREIAGARIIKNLTGKDVPVTLDPTMLLTAHQWEKLIEKSTLKVKRKYIVKYFLGSRDVKNESIIDDFAEDNGLLVVDILCGEKYKNMIGPIEFVWLLANSEFNFVDSFHGGVFSLIFNKKFLIFDRPSEEGTGRMNSRIDTLLSTFKLEEKLIYSLSTTDIMNYSQDNESVNEILEIKRDESIQYLTNSINTVLA